MRKLTSKDLKELNLLKHYRIIRKWMCRTCDIKDADLELLIYLDSKRNRTTQKYNIYKVSFKCKQLISRMYRIMLGEEDIPPLSKKDKYSDKVLMSSITNVNQDKTR